uniref:HAT C-terminal dimerisation domain-containing protein n=1 Tax=Sphaeramia orbicularis TaxID=375764 RepID=A0A673AIY5_9TELE
MANTSTPCHLYPKLINLLQSAGCPNLNSAHTYTHHDTVSEMEDAIATTITSATNDCIANSKYVGIIVDETTYIVVEKMLVIYLTLQQNGRAETVFLGNFLIPCGTAECIAAKIKDVLLARGVALHRVVGLGSDGVSVMLGRKAGVAQQLRQTDCPYLINVHCGEHRTALAACDTSKAVREEGDLLSLKQPSATRWLSLERAVKGVRTNWAALVMELEEEEAVRGCLVAKGIRKQLQMYMFPALTHLLTDVLAMVNCMNLTFQREDVVLNMTLDSLDDLMNEPGEVERKFFDTFTRRQILWHHTQADAQTFSVLHTEYIAEVTKSIKKRFPLEHVGIITDLDTVLNKSGYPTADSALKSYGMEALERPLVQKECTLRDFLPVKRVLAQSGNPTFRESGRLLITSLGEMFPDFKTLAEVALVIPVSSVAAERGFSLQNQIKTAMGSRLSEAKVQNLMTITSAAISCDAFDYAQASTNFKSQDQEEGLSSW